MCGILYKLVTLDPSSYTTCLLKEQNTMIGDGLVRRWVGEKPLSGFSSFSGKHQKFCFWGWAKVLILEHLQQKRFRLSSITFSWPMSWLGKAIQGSTSWSHCFEVNSQSNTKRSPHLPAQGHCPRTWFFFWSSSVCIFLFKQKPRLAVIVCHFWVSIFFPPQMQTIFRTFLITPFHSGFLILLGVSQQSNKYPARPQQHL